MKFNKIAIYAAIAAFAQAAINFAATLRHKATGKQIIAIKASIARRYRAASRLEGRGDALNDLANELYAEASDAFNAADKYASAQDAVIARLHG